MRLFIDAHRYNIAIMTVVLYISTRGCSLANVNIY